MDNELKAKELYYYHCTKKSCRGFDDCKKCPKSKAIISLLMMATWKEQQMIEKMVNWIALHAEMYGSFNGGKLNEMAMAMKKAMEEKQ